MELCRWRGRNVGEKLLQIDEDVGMWLTVSFASGHTGKVRVVDEKHRRGSKAVQMV